MTNEKIENYKKALDARNEYPYEVGCQTCEWLQDELNYYYKALCKAEREGEVTKKEIMEALKR